MAPSLTSQLKDSIGWLRGLEQSISSSEVLPDILARADSLLRYLAGAWRSVPGSDWVFFCLIWVAVSYLISRAGGWHRLLAKYRVTEPVKGKSFTCHSCLVGGVRCKNCILFTANRFGLGISMSLILGTGRLKW